jgi:L-ribulokinase
MEPIRFVRFWFNVSNGEEVADAVYNYEHGVKGVVLGRNPNMARQHPSDYLKGATQTIRKVLNLAKKRVKGFSSEQVIGLGVDTTGSTPMPVDAKGVH